MECAGRAPLGTAAALTPRRAADALLRLRQHPRRARLRRVPAVHGRRRRPPRAATCSSTCSPARCPPRGRCWPPRRPMASPRTRDARRRRGRRGRSAPTRTRRMSAAPRSPAPACTTPRRSSSCAIPRSSRSSSRRGLPTRAGSATASTRCSAACARRASRSRWASAPWPGRPTCRAPTRRRTWRWLGRRRRGRRRGPPARLTPFDYLALRADDTARRLVDPQLRAFLDEDRRPRPGPDRDHPRGRRGRPQPAPGRRAPRGPPQHGPVSPAPHRGAHRAQPAADGRPPRPAGGHRARRRARRAVLTSVAASTSPPVSVGSQRRMSSPASISPCSTPPSSSRRAPIPSASPAPSVTRAPGRARRSLAGRQRTARALRAATGHDVLPAQARKLADPLLADHPATDLTYERGRRVLRVGRRPAAHRRRVGGGRARRPTGAHGRGAHVFDPDCCACVESGWGWTAPVTAHPAGASPCGAAAARRQRVGVGVRPNRGRRLARGARRLLSRPRLGRARRARSGGRPGARHAHHRLSPRHRPRERP